ncbi:MAG: superfamily and helicase [Caulobacteraceae bacterium]|nr:superfamily and helicase [Caulobacteraceae bacterium]
MSDRSAGAAPARLVAVLGPTNTGKTHLAVERMLGHRSGMIGLPLRLLAREVYDRIARARGPRSVALITGEEKIVPPHAAYFVCTVEAMPLTRSVEFLAIDEIQLAADPERGHVFTHRLLNARGTMETMLMGAATLGPLVRRLLPGVEIVARERFSALSYSGSKKLTRLPRRSAVVAFNTDQVYALAELIRRQRGGAAVVMGSLSPRTRNAQVGLYQSGEVDFLVATDAIGMGLNMDIDHVAFAGLSKFDGRHSRALTPQEVAQIAGRAGRFTRNGSFGVTGEAPEMDQALVSAVEEHRFAPIKAAQWRNARLDFSSLKGLMNSLSTRPPREELALAPEALDEKTLHRLASDPEIAERARNPEVLHRLWEVCQLPDFRKSGAEPHQRLVLHVFDALTTGKRRLRGDWMAAEVRPLDRTEGEIDTLAARLAAVRTLTYLSNRNDWLEGAAEWQGRTRALEDRLSDALHQRLTARFVDRRTSVLMRALGQGVEPLAVVAKDGEVTIEGQVVGHLAGVDFRPERGSSLLEKKALSAAAARAVEPQIVRRLGALAAGGNEAFSLSPDGSILWNEAVVGVLTGGSAHTPRVRLLGQLGPIAARQRAERRLEAFVAVEASRLLASIAALEQALAGGGLSGLPRGLAHQLVEAGGVLPRERVEAQVAALSQAERRTLRSLGVRIGAYSLWLPGLLTDAARPLAIALAGGEPWAAPSALHTLPNPPPSDRALSARGLRAVGGLAVPVEQLERLEAALRAGEHRQGGQVLTPEAIAELGWSEKQARILLAGLNYVSVSRPKAGEAVAWRRRRLKPAPVAPLDPASPFAALSALTAAPAPPRKRRRRPVGKATA